MITFTEHQKKIIEHNGGHALVMAGPGSGKTTTLTERAYYLFEKQRVGTNDICVLVFNRDIALKLKQDIGARFGSNDAPHTSTVHSFVLSQTLKHGAQLLGDFEIGDKLGSLGKKKVVFKPIAERLKDKHNVTKTPDGKKLTTHYVETKLWGDLRDYWLTAREPTDSLFPKFKYEVERLKKILNIVFFDELAIKFLKEIEANSSFREAVKKGKVIIDEFQDLNPTEHALLRAFHGAGVEFMCFGDDDQAINEFRRANADLVQDFKKTYSPAEYSLPRDRRCPREILELADSFVSPLPGRLPKLEGCAPHQGRIDILEFADDEQEKNNLPKIVSKFLEQAPTASGNPQVLILSGRVGGASNKSRIDEIIDVLKNNGIEDISIGEFRDPFDIQFGLALRGLLTILKKPDSSLGLYVLLTFMKPRLINELLQHIESVEQKGESLSFFAASEALKENNLELKALLEKFDALRERVRSGDFTLDNLFSLLPKELSGEEIVKKLANEIWQQISNSNEGEEKNEEKLSNGERFIRDFDPQVADFVGKNVIKRVHVTTYRKAKGLEADLVVVTGTDNSAFADTPPNRRLLYVAATRTKKNLVLTFASRRTKARRYTKDRPSGARGNPNSYRSPLIPRNYTTASFNNEWLQNWNPIL